MFDQLRQKHGMTESHKLASPLHHFPSVMLEEHQRFFTAINKNVRLGKQNSAGEICDAFVGKLLQILCDQVTLLCCYAVMGSCRNASILLCRLTVIVLLSSESMRWIMKTHRPVFPLW